MDSNDQKNIQSFCPLPWVHLSMEPTGKIFSCCNTSAEKEIGDIRTEQIDEILIGNNNRKIAEIFKSGAAPLQCKLCFEEETRGKISLRQSSLREFSNVHPDSNFTLRYLSLRFDNTCNLKCRTCGPMLSTAWYQDIKSMTGNSPNSKVTSFRDQNDFEHFLNNIPSALEILYFAGGEPLITSKFYDVLERLIKDERTSIRIIINTNMTELKLGQRNSIELLSQFDNVSLDMSIDAIGPVGELQRSGMNWEKVKENIFYIKKTFPQIKLKIFPTICNLNIFSLTETCEFFLSHSILKCEDIVLNPLTLPEHLCIANIPDVLKTEIKENLFSYMKLLFLKWDYDIAISLVTQIKGVINLLEQPAKESYFDEFIRVTRQLDKLRGEKFSVEVPKFSSFFDK